MTEHVHVWRGGLNLDGCHHYTNTYVCDCGASMSISGERQMMSRGRMQPGMMMAGDDCERCSALIAGARRKPTMRHYLAPGESKWVRVKLYA